MSLVLEGLFASPRSFSPAELARLDGQVADLGTLLPGKSGPAVRLAALLAAAAVADTARWLSFDSADRFRIAVPLATIRDRAAIAYDVPEASGGPVRLYVLDAPACHAGEEIDRCANVKRLAAIRATAEREPDIDHQH